MSKEKKMPQQEEKKTVIYLGPEIPGVVAAGTVFKNGLTKKLEEEIKEIPAINMLLVPVRDVVKVKKELAKEASAVKICYQKVAEYAAKKGAV